MEHPGSVRIPSTTWLDTNKSHYVEEIVRLAAEMNRLHKTCDPRWFQNLEMLAMRSWNLVNGLRQPSQPGASSALEVPELQPGAQPGPSSGTITQLPDRDRLAPMMSPEIWPEAAATAANLPPADRQTHPNCPPDAPPAVRQISASGPWIWPPDLS